MTHNKPPNNIDIIYTSGSITGRW